MAETSLNVPLIAAPQYQDVTKGLRDTLVQNEARQAQKQAIATQSLKDFAPIAQKMTIADTLAKTKTQLDDENLAAINSRYEQSMLEGKLQLDNQFSKEQKLLDDAYNKEKAVHTPGYDTSGNVIPFTPSAEYQSAQEQFDNKFQNYQVQQQQILDQANATALATANAGYDPRNLRETLNTNLMTDGIGIGAADAAATLASKPYEAKELTPQQKLIMEGRQKGLEAVLKGRIDQAGEVYKGDFKTTLGAKGNSAGGVGTKDAAAKAGYNNLEVSAGRVMDTFDNLGWGIWKDNKGIVEDILTPAFRENFGNIAPGEIADIIISLKDDGIIKNTLQSGVGKAEVDAVIKQRIAQRIAGNAQSVVTSGRKGATNKQYQQLVANAQAKYDRDSKSLANEFNSSRNKSDGIRNLTQILSGDAPVFTPEKADTKPPKQDSPSVKKSLFTGNDVVSKAMKSKSGDGALVKALETNPKEFGDTYRDMTPKQQKAIDKTLNTKQNKTLLEALDKRNPNVTPPKVKTSSVEDINKSIKELGKIDSTEKYDLKKSLETKKTSMVLSKTLKSAVNRGGIAKMSDSNKENWAALAEGIKQGAINTRDLPKNVLAFYLKHTKTLENLLRGERGVLEDKERKASAHDAKYNLNPTAPLAR